MTNNKNEHKHEWNENLECACGAKFGPPEKTISPLTDLTKAINDHENSTGPRIPSLPEPISLVPQNKPAIQIIVELRKKIIDVIDEAMEEILKEEKK